MYSDAVPQNRRICDGGLLRNVSRPLRVKRKEVTVVTGDGDVASWHPPARHMKQVEDDERAAGVEGVAAAAAAAVAAAAAPAAAYARQDHVRRRILDSAAVMDPWDYDSVAGAEDGDAEVECSGPASDDCSSLPS